MSDVEQKTDSAPAGEGGAEPQKPGPPLIVLKFGSALVGGADYPHEAVHEVYRWVREGHDVLVVVSAPQAETDTLIALAEQIGHGGRSAHLPRLLRVGEMRSAAILALALERVGLKAGVMDPHEMGLKAEGDRHDATLTGCDATALRAQLDASHVVVVPGYVALEDDGELAMLGRGGADYTAAYLGDALDADRVRLVKDVDGLYDSAASGEAGKARYAQIGWADAAAHGAGLVQAKALRFAEEAGRPLELAAPGRAYATAMGPVGPRLETAAARPLSVALLGCGTVGGGVYAYLKRHADLFTVARVFVRTPDSPRYEDVPRALLTDQADDPAITGADIVLESIGGLDPATDLVCAALERGQDVVTANKEIFARRFDRLRAAAEQGGAELRASASVGGGVPAIEAVDAARAEGRSFARISGVANGTANFVLDEMEAGLSLDEAVKLAQEAGYAEADPTADVDGWDAASKLCILARRATDAEISPDDAERDSLRDISQDDIKAAAAEGKRLRQVGTFDPDTGKVTVKIAALDTADFLAGARGPENRFRIVFGDGSERAISGLGAGRWPTAEAMFADLLDLHRLRAQPAAQPG